MTTLTTLNPICTFRDGGSKTREPGIMSLRCVREDVYIRVN